MRTLLVALAILTLFAGGVQADATYVVATTGNDTNPGNASAPFRTLAKGVSVLKPGDTLLVRAGTYTGSKQLEGIPGGTSWKKPVTIKAYPGERPVLVAEPKNTEI